MNDNKNICSVNNVTKSFGDVVAVSEVTFSVTEKSITGFLGPNGSGKTTIIRMLLGLTQPRTGSIELFGQNPFKSYTIKNFIGYVPEREVFLNISALDFLTSLGRYYLPREVAHKRAIEVLEELEFQDVKNKKISQFSKGMKQQMKVAQSLIHKPKFIIADEPFNGLDPLVRKKLFDIFRKYRQEYDTTFFVSSHILFEVEKLADQMILLYKGRSIAQGSPGRIRSLMLAQPHAIQISSPKTKELAKVLIDYSITEPSLISSIAFSTDKVDNRDKILIETLQPKEMYRLITDIVVDHNIIVQEVASSEEGLENLYKLLTIG